MENKKYGRRREGRWTPIRAKAQDTRANPNSWETHLVRKRRALDSYGIEPRDYDDDDDDDAYVMNIVITHKCHTGLSSYDSMPKRVKPRIRSSTSKESSIYDVQKNQVFDPPPPVHMGPHGPGPPPPLWTSTHGRQEIHTALLEWLVQ